MTIQSAAVEKKVGAWLARNLVAHEVDMTIASKDAGKAKELASSLGNRARSRTKALGAGIEVVLAVPAEAATAVLEEAKGILGAIVIDCTNPMTWNAGPVHAPPRGGLHHGPAGPTVSEHPPRQGVQHVRRVHADPKTGTTTADVSRAMTRERQRRCRSSRRRSATSPSWCGPLQTRATSSLAMLWIHLATVGGGAEGRGVQASAWLARPAELRGLH